MHDRQLLIRGELLRVLGEGLLKEQAKTRESAFLYEESRRANRAKDEFLSILSHELRTPLNAMVASIALAQTKTKDPVFVGRQLDTIARNVKAQVHIIDDLLDVSRIVTGKLRIEVAPVDLASLISESLNTIRPAAEAKSISLERELDHCVGTLIGDRDRLQQVLWNLLSNAVKFTPSNGCVRVRLRRVGDSKAAIDVIDTGEGIEAEFLPHVFERFTQSDSSAARRHLGLGLGLAIARHLVEMHGGTIAAESPEGGRGTRFTIELPVKRESDAAITEESKSSQVTSAASLENGETSTQTQLDPHMLAGLVVMVVDDNVEARELVSELLELAGAQVVLAGSAPEALNILERVQPDVLVADIGLPDEDGYSLLKKVRALPPERGGRVPAVALTGFTRQEDRQLAESAGFQRHLSKPLKVEDLVSAVKSLTDNQ
jgi:CheY-like chemotaxis protein